MRTVIVTDAAVVVTALLDDGPDGDRVRRRLAVEASTAPELLDLEVVSALRRLVDTGEVTSTRAAQALDDLGDLDVVRVAHPPLVPRCWELRDNLTAYDAAYVALAEAQEATLVTGDRRLANAPGPRCPFEVL